MVIDCDSHIMLRDAFEHVDETLKARMPRLMLDSNGLFQDIDFPSNPAHVPGTTPIPPNDATLGIEYAGNIDVEARLRDYDRMGVDVHLVLPQFTGWWSYLLEPAVGSALAHSWNIALLSLMSRYPGKIDGVALIPLQDVAASMHELNWAVTNGFRAIVADYVYPVAEHPYGTTLASHAELWPFFASAEELDVPIFLHAVQHGHRILNVPRFHERGLYLSAPTDSELNLISLITSGLLDDFPRLQFIHAEMGAAGIQPLAERLDKRFDRMIASHPSFKDLPLVPATLTKERNKRRPSDYFKNNFYWTIETEEPELSEAIAFLGAERFLFATDYPHNDTGGLNKFNDVGRLRRHQSISESEKELILYKNARRLFKI